MPQKQNILKLFLLAVFFLALFGGAGEASVSDTTPPAITISCPTGTPTYSTNTISHGWLSR